MKLASSLALLFALLPVALGAQEATPTPNPLVYDDPAMHCQIPDGWFSGGQRQIPLAELGDDPATVAAWVGKNGDHLLKMILQQQHFEGTLDIYEATLEQQIRGDTADGVVRGKERVSLKNGMPAYFVTAVSGSGFDTSKSFMLGWVDGQRGVALIVTSQVGGLDNDGAKKILSGCSAVAYPLDRQ